MSRRATAQQKRPVLPAKRMQIIHGGDESMFDPEDTPVKAEGKAKSEVHEQHRCAFEVD